MVLMWWVVVVPWRQILLADDVGLTVCVHILDLAPEPAARDPSARVEDLLDALGTDLARGTITNIMTAMSTDIRICMR
ncbi:hypothetical protein [Georgenia sp. SUBG003]|uniref:hypothetical protein n=1 Tax=Georgenia sp. SUBG003 TaxID=1497974 RepID=UPI003AB3F1E0